MKLINNLKNQKFKEGLLLGIILSFIFILGFYIGVIYVFSQGQQRFTVFKTDNEGFRFSKKYPNGADLTLLTLKPTEIEIPMSRAIIGSQISQFGAPNNRLYSFGIYATYTNISSYLTEIAGDLRVYNNRHENYRCRYIPENGFYDLDQVSEIGTTSCPDGMFMTEIIFRGSSRDINSLDMWRIKCCPL